MKQIRYFIPALLWMVIIFIMSHQTGNTSAGLSLKITKFLHHFIYIHIDVLHTFVRKGAHITCFALLALFLYYGFYHLIKEKVFLFTFFVSVGYACFDEIHQLFITNRSGQVLDIVIDTSGVLLMLSILYIIKHIYRKI